MLTNLQEQLLFGGSRSVAPSPPEKILSGNSNNNPPPHSGSENGTPLRMDINEAFVPILGIAFLILICLVAFVWGANSAKRSKDSSYMLRNDRNHNNRYRTFT